MTTLRWWQTAVFYQIYPRSFADGNGDGIGDFPGMTSKLDYLRDLGVDAIWLSPHFPSPQADCGYDITDYTGVAPEYGTLEDFTAFLHEAHARGIRVILDLVLNHTSDQHPWFAEFTRQPRQSQARLVHLARWQGRRPAQQLGLGLRRIGVGAGRGDRPVLLSLPPHGAARPQLAQPRGQAGDLGRRALLAGSGRGWLSARRRLHDLRASRPAESHRNAIAGRSARPAHGDGWRRRGRDAQRRRGRAADDGAGRGRAPGPPSRASTGSRRPGSSSSCCAISGSSRACTS